MKIKFFILAFTVLISINSYVAVRGWHALPNISIIRPIYLFGIIVLFLTLMGTMFFGDYMPKDIAKVSAFIGYTYVVVFAYLLLSFLLVDIVRVANHFFHFFPSGMSVIRLWAMVGTLAITGIALVVGHYKFNHPSIVTLNLRTDKPKQNKELKIVAVSDLHLGICTDKKDLKNYVKLINNQHPDIVLLVGDISDRSIKPLIRQNMAEELRSIIAELGVFAINGNHEYYAEKTNATAQYLESAGIRVLRDSSCLVENSFYLIGRDDRTNHQRKKLSEITEGLDKTKLLILMDHQPFHLEEAEQNEIDFQISGHTHNGQFFPINLLEKKMYELSYGYLKKGFTHYYVSSGLSLWGPPYRIGTQSELVVINLMY